MGHTSLRDALAAMEAKGLLHRITKRLSKDSEVMPLVRWQYRGLPEEQRKAFLFTDLTDGRGRSYEADLTVASIGASRPVYACALDCTVQEVRDLWIRAQTDPIVPVIVGAKGAPVKEMIQRGEDVGRLGLDAFPIPVSTPGYDPAPFVTSGCWVTKDPETGVRNVGNYRGMVKARDRIGLQMFPSQHDGIHWAKWKARGHKYMEAVVLIGPPPAVNMTAVAKLPYGVDEYTVSGALMGGPIELVKCETVDLEVPATTEIVLEGRISTEVMEPEAPFGEFSGYMGERADHPIMEITCITHRRRPIWHAFISQFPPSESTKVRSMANEANYYNLLRNHCNIPSVLDVTFPEAQCGQNLIVVRMKKQMKAQPAQALMATASLDPTYGKIIIAVDEDVDPYDLDSVMWAVCTRMQPHMDMQIIMNRAAILDPSMAPPESSAAEQFYPEPRGGSAVLIDATRKWDYPPASLPKEELMVRARDLWEELGLPALNPRKPWYGYAMGPWPTEWEEEADLAIKGRYYETGDKLAKQRKPA